MSEILVVAAHPDDEILGCGATLARHADAGDRVHILILATGLAARGAIAAGALEALEGAAGQAARAVGAEAPRFAGFPDNRLDGMEMLDIAKPTEAVVEGVAPEIVYTHHGGDLNIDHRIACEAVATACRPLPGAAVRAIYAFETVSSTEWAVSGAHAAFRPNLFVDVTAYMEAKMCALAAYASEMRPSPHARSEEAVRALAALRGASVGCVAAEAFSVIRELR
ncbi:MAG: PIG-L deacetylase family protein [Alphaproteobacteria bacterium]|nr:PIG-L deacetylase family protein [Alphaproteobacteria bacterium]